MPLPLTNLVVAALAVGGVATGVGTARRPRRPRPPRPRSSPPRPSSTGWPRTSPRSTVTGPGTSATTPRPPRAGHATRRRGTGGITAATDDHGVHGGRRPGVGPAPGRPRRHPTRCRTDLRRPRSRGDDRAHAPTTGATPAPPVDRTTPTGHHARRSPRPPPPRRPPATTTTTTPPHHDGDGGDGDDWRRPRATVSDDDRRRTGARHTGPPLAATLAAAPPPGVTGRHPGLGRRLGPDGRRRRWPPPRCPSRSPPTGRPWPSCEQTIATARGQLAALGGAGVGGWLAGGGVDTGRPVRPPATTAAATGRTGASGGAGRQRRPPGPPGTRHRSGRPGQSAGAIAGRSRAVSAPPAPTAAADLAGRRRRPHAVATAPPATSPPATVAAGHRPAPGDHLHRRVGRHDRDSGAHRRAGRGRARHRPGHGLRGDAVRPGRNRPIARRLRPSAQALAVFPAVHAACTRFDRTSPLMLANAATGRVARRSAGCWSTPLRAAAHARPPGHRWSVRSPRPRRPRASRLRPQPPLRGRRGDHRRRRDPAVPHADRGVPGSAAGDLPASTSVACRWTSVVSASRSAVRWAADILAGGVRRLPARCRRRLLLRGHRSRA